LENAARKAADLGANTFQIFSASPRMWRAGVPDPQQVRLLRAARDQFDLHPLVIHVNYLINLASLDPVIRGKSIAAFRGELERAHAIGAEYLVLHTPAVTGARQLNRASPLSCSDCATRRRVCLPIRSQSYWKTLRGPAVIWAVAWRN
jgi:endonuclease IV